MHEIGTNLPKIVCGFYTKYGRWDTLFLNKRTQGFISEILRMVSLLGEKFIFSTPLGLPEFYEFVNFLFIFILCPSTKAFQNILNYASTSNNREVMKFYNLDNKSFETDIN